MCIRDRLLPSALETIDPPPIPIDIPTAESKNEMGKITEIAPIASSPMYLPTKNVSTTIFNDITIKPIAAGAD